MCQQLFAAILYLDQNPLYIEAYILFRNFKGDSGIPLTLPARVPDTHRKTSLVIWQINLPCLGINPLGQVV